MANSTIHETAIIRDAIRDLVQAAGGIEREFRKHESLRIDLLAKAETAIFKINRAFREAAAERNVAVRK